MDKKQYRTVNYLSQEEQFKEVLNNEEIARIENWELREIRSKYWGLKHKAFLDEHGIPDCELAYVFDRLRAEECEEIENYKRKKGMIESNS